MLQRRPNTFYVALFLLGVITTGCLRAPDPRVGVKPLTADLVFGIPPLDEPVGPPLPDEIESDIAFDDRAIRDPIRPRPTFTNRQTCPDADSKQVRYGNGNVPSNLPPAGEFRWKNEGYIKTDTGLKIPLAAFERRSIKDIQIEKKAANGTPLDYNWITEEREIGTSDLVRTFWRVVTSQVIVSPVDGSMTDTGLNGTFITKVETIKGGETNTFDPRPDVLVLPWKSGADVGDLFGRQERYVDPDSQETWQLEGTVVENRGFDACGEMIDSRFVDGFLRVVTANDGTHDYNFDYGIAQPYGSILIAEVVEACDRDFELNQAATDAAKRCVGATGETRPVKAAYTRHIAEIPPDPA